MTDSTSNKYLEKDVKDFVTNKIKDVKHVDEILGFYPFTINVPKSENIEELYQELYLSKKILQLTINHYNYFDAYKDCFVKFQTHQPGDLATLISFYSYDHVRDLWFCSSYPKEADVIDALFNYVLCFKSLEMAEDNYINLNDAKMRNIDRCPFCDDSILPGDDNCGTCYASIKDIRIVIKKKNPETICDVIGSINLKENSNCDDSSSSISKPHKSILIKHHVENKEYNQNNNAPSNIIISDDNSDCDDDSPKLSKDSKSLKIGQSRQRDYNEECNQKEVKATRKCVTCGNIDHINDVLLGEDSWICTQCVQNDRNDDWTDIFNMDTQNLNKDHRICERCGRDTNSMVKCCQYCRDQPDNGDQRKWKCKLCGTMFPYTMTVCLSCNCSMVDDGLWMCMGCTYWNKFVDSRCDVCFTMNDSLMVKFCQLCKKTKIGLDELFCSNCIEESNSRWNTEMWQCNFIDCRRWTDNKFEFCTECGLWRYSFDSHKEGDTLRRCKHGEESEVWICSSCRRFNKVESLCCEGWLCSRKRYDENNWQTKWKCRSCQTLYDYNVTKCAGCDGSMEDIGLWLCKSCTFGNRFVDSRCEVCYTMNDHLVVKFCQLCKKKKINLNELFCEMCEENNNSKLNKGWWQCGFRSCGIWSEDEKEYCQECGLGRYSFIDYKQGKALKRFKNGKMIAVWICEYCPRFNDVNSVKCNGWFCRKSRYGKRHCDYCRYYNDGSSVACMRCSKLL